MSQAGDWLAFANTLADEADGISLPAFDEAKRVEHKADGTFVTATDVGVERRLRAMIADTFPDHAFLGEEDGLTGDPDAPRWIIDPIDGTNNFVSGNPVWATLIALQSGGTEANGDGARVAVVSAPALGSRWDGMIDGDVSAARQDGRPVTVSAKSLADGEVSYGGLKYFLATDRGPLVERLARATRRQRGYGDFWQHCLVAAGVIEVAIEAEVSPWDLAAVKIVVEAAGGRFTDLDGRPTIDGGNALSTNGLVHDEVLALIRA